MGSCCFAELSKKDPKSFFLFWARVLFGFWLLYLGLAKWLPLGPEGFIAYTQGAFAETFLPAISVTITAWIIVIGEVFIGVGLLFGKRQRCFWTGATLLMFILLVGKTVLQDHTTVANIWQYLVLALTCAALSSSCGAGACCKETKEKDSCCSETKEKDNCCS